MLPSSVVDVPILTGDRIIDLLDYQKQVGDVIYQAKAIGFYSIQDSDITNSLVFDDESEATTLFDSIHQPDNYDANSGAVYVDDALLDPNAGSSSPLFGVVI